MAVSVNQRLYHLLEPQRYSLSSQHQEKIEGCLKQGLDFEDPWLSYKIVSQPEISNRSFLHVLNSPARFDIPVQEGQTALHLLARFRPQISYLKDVLNRYDAVFQAIQTALHCLPTAVNQMIDSYLGSKKDALNLQTEKGETPLHEALFNKNLPGAELLASETRLSLGYFYSTLGDELSKLRGEGCSLWAWHRSQQLKVEFSRQIGNESMALDQQMICRIVSAEVHRKFRVIKERSTHWEVKERLP